MQFAIVRNSEEQCFRQVEENTLTPQDAFGSQPDKQARGVESGTRSTIHPLSWESLLALETVDCLWISWYFWATEY